MQLTEATAFRSTYNVPFAMSAIHICFVLLSYNNLLNLELFIPFHRWGNWCSEILDQLFTATLTRKWESQIWNKDNQISQRLSLNKLISELNNNKNIKASCQILTLPPRIATLCPQIYSELYPRHRNDLV